MSMSIPGFRVKAPKWFEEAEKSGAIKEIVKDNTILGYAGYQRAKQVAIIMGVVALILFITDGPEKFAISSISIIAALASIVLKQSFNEQKDAIMKIHNRILSDSGQHS